jgi:hypothetical protein
MMFLTSNSAGNFRLSFFEAFSAVVERVVPAVSEAVMACKEVTRKHNEQIQCSDAAPARSDRAANRFEI